MLPNQSQFLIARDEYASYLGVRALPLQPQLTPRLTPALSSFHVRWAAKKEIDDVIDRAAGAGGSAGPAAEYDGSYTGNDVTW